MQSQSMQWWVGVFMFVGAMALLFLAYRVSNFGYGLSSETYSVRAEFDNIGNLQLRAPIKMAGVKIGEVRDITLDPKTYKAVVTFFLEKKHNQIPEDSAASILTAGLLGANYVSLTPGFDDHDFLAEGDLMEDTQSALILENMIGRLIFSLANSSKQPEAVKTEEKQP